MSNRNFRIQLHVPCRNEEERLPRFIDSISAQTFTDFQVIFHNNASTDSTEQILREFQACKEPGKVIVNCYKTPASGLEYGQRIRWFPHQSEYISLRSANDLLSPEYLDRCVKILDNNSDVGLAYSNGYLVYERDPSIGYHSKESEIRTDVQDLENSVSSCVERYTQSFAMWGVYRRSVYERLTSWRLTCYGADHIQVCEYSLYGSVVPTDEPLDIRLVRGTKENNSSPDDIKSMWQAHHLMEGLGVPSDNVLMPLDYGLPFHSMMLGYVDMFRTAHIAHHLKMRLIDIALNKFRNRFSAILQAETEYFLSKYATSQFLRDRLDADQNHLLSLDSEILRWVNALTFSTPVHMHEISRAFLKNLLFTGVYRQ
jgi:glycosyltransferase involved in cell wall biosynthesis